MHDFHESVGNLFILYVLHQTGLSENALHKQTGVSQNTINKAKTFQYSITWRTIYRIEKATGYTFRSPEHLEFCFQYKMQNPELFND